MPTETPRIDSDDPIRIDTEHAIRIDMDLENVTPATRARKYTSPSGGKFASVWKGIGQ